MPIFGLATLLATQSAEVSEVLTEGAGTLILLAAAFLVYRSFRERYLGIWISGWVLYSACREITIAAEFHGLVPWLAFFSQLCFVFAVTFFVWAMLDYTNSRKFLPVLFIFCFATIVCAMLRLGWLPHSTVLLILFHVLYRGMTVLGSARLVLFSRGRREVGPWMMALMLLLIHYEENTHSEPALFVTDALIEILLGLSILVIVLDDSRAGKHRLEVFNALTTTIAEARNSDSMMQDALARLKELSGSRYAWVRMLEGGKMVLQQHIGLGDKLTALRPAVPFQKSMFERFGSDQGPVIASYAHLDENLQQEMTDLGLAHLVILPLRGNASFRGALILGMARFRRYSVEEKRFLVTTSRHLGLALENVQLFEQIIGSHRRWIRTFDSIDDLILVHDGEQRIVRANRAFVSKLDRSLRDVLGLKCEKILPNSPQGCPYCLRSRERVVDAPDPCFGGFSTVSTSRYAEEPDAEYGTIHVIRDTTDIHLAEERFRALFEQMQEGVFISTPQGRLLECNDAFVRMLGFADKSEVFSLDLSSYLYSVPEHRDEHEKAMARDGFVRNYEFTHRRRDGSPATLLESSFATHDRGGQIQRYQGFLFDITEQKHAEEKIRRQNRELYALNAIATVATQTFDLEETAKEALGQAMDLFEASAAGVLLVEQGGTLLRVCATEGEHKVAVGETYEVQPQFWGDFMADRSGLISATSIENLPHEIRPAIDPEMHRALCMAMWASQREPLGLFLVSRRADREFTSSDYDLMATIARQLAISIERTRLYTETKRAYQDLRNTQEQLLQSEKMSSLGRLISGVAHELNNPLTAILGYAQLLEAETVSTQAKDFLNKLYKQAQRTGRIVQSLLSFARQRKPQKTEIQLAQVLEETLALREPDLRLNGITVSRSIHPVPTVIADAHQIEQVFLNIINNAADAILDNSPSGGTIEISIFENRGCACVEFHDSGPGIAELSRVFDPFYTTKKLGKGTGLGLSICYGIMQEHGGAIVASNHLQGGAIFQLRLPLEAASAEAASLISHATSPQAPSS